MLVVSTSTIVLLMLKNVTRIFSILSHQPTYAMDTIADSSRIFKEIAVRFGAQPISDSIKLKEFFAELLGRTGGFVILDFLDQSNWDSIESFHLNQESGILTLTWHDYREAQESAKDREHRHTMFSASLYASALQIKSIVPIVGTTSAVFLINAYAKTEKEIRNVYKGQAEEFNLLDNSFFEKRVVRKIAGQWEIIDFHCTPIFSMAIVPKRSGISTLVSKRILYH